MTTKLSPLKQIRLKCLDCCCGSSHEVKLCTSLSCPLWKLRFKKTRPKQVIFTREQREIQASMGGDGA